ncbi:MAG: hypothetical protein IT376_01310 [Polyangiaceae bacterium]|nr:hypothetical protein [Polyangiaceae bacterium]
MSARGSALLLALAASCASRSPPQASVDVGRAPPRPAAPAAPPAAVTEGALVECGASRCRAGVESCCFFASGGACVASVAPGVDDASQLLASQLAACEQAPHEYSLTEIRRCDESSDCPAGQACCGRFLFGGAAAALCEPLGSPGPAACELAERCRVTETCRTPGSVCDDGACRRPVSLTCAGLACPASAAACCGEAPACRAPDACPPHEPRYRCAAPVDCLPGEHCALSAFGSVCTAFVDLANTRRVCATAADCGGGDPLCARYECAPSEVPGVLACRCP